METMTLTQTYKPKTFNLSGLTGISDKTLEMHFKLYEGYVTNTTLLSEKIASILEDGRVDKEEMPAYSELTRRLGFEYNGMVLHEYYFGNMKRNAGDNAPRGSKFRAAIERSFPSFEIWKTDFTSVGKMRGVGWAIAYISIQPRGGSRITGSSCTKTATWPASSRCS
jgi:Fe-Mn family superoxide dismutase